MAKRLQIQTRRRTSRAKKQSSAREFFLNGKDVEFIPTGCVLLDCALGGGIAEGRIFNVVGDKSSGKTLLAIEACANFALKHKAGKIRYCEAEASFDESYAGILGMPLDRVSFKKDVATVEELGLDIDAFAKDCDGTNGLYVLDSLDAVSDKAEMERKEGEGSYGASKAKYLSEMFRKKNKAWSRAGITVMIVSQIRDKLNVTFGRRFSRSGGRALDFYASQVLFLAEVKKEIRTVRGVKRATGIVVKARVDKNKVGLPFREVEFPLVFGYGIDDLQASLEWLKKVNRLQRLDVKVVAPAVKKFRNDKRFIKRARDLVRKEWAAIEESFLPTERKYQ